MPSEKNISVSYRVAPRFRDLLKVAAARANRSQTNMLETLLFDYCERHHITSAPKKGTGSIGEKRK